MNLRVTVAATAIHGALVGRYSLRQIRTREQAGGVRNILVALLAQEGPRHHEQAFIAGAMGRVATQAILTHRRVLPDEWTTFFAVARVTELVHAVRLEQRPGDRAVGIVAVLTGYLALQQRHVRALAKLHALLLMAGEAGLADAALREEPRDREFRHWIMAIAAGEAARLMDRSLPEHALAALVAQ